MIRNVDQRRSQGCSFAFVSFAIVVVTLIWGTVSRSAWQSDAQGEKCRRTEFSADTSMQMPSATYRFYIGVSSRSYYSVLPRILRGIEGGRFLLLPFSASAFLYLYVFFRLMEAVLCLFLRGTGPGSERRGNLSSKE